MIAGRHAASYILTIVMFLLHLAASPVPAAQDLPSIEYYHPLNKSKYVSRETNIVIRPGDMLDKKANLSAIAAISGNTSGDHDFEAIISDDNRSLVLIPSRPFAPGETVAVKLLPGLKTVDGEAIGSLDWEFTISAKTEKLPVIRVSGDEIADNRPRISYYPDDYGALVETTPAGVSIPLDFPPRTVLEANNPDSGYLFLSNFRGDDPQYLMILDNEANPVYYQRVSGNTFDFKKQPNGWLTYYTYYDYFFHAMDSSYTVVDSFQCGNGYELGTDPHDLQILDNGHALMMAYDQQDIDMSEIVECGQRNAAVIGLIIQELDTLKNVIWQWSSWDHFEITDATWDIDLCSYRIDYVHGNSLELDTDGNLLLSSRNLDEITKIDRTSGEIIWRWGGENNEFTFINDPQGFSHQHDLRLQPDGHYTLFDNGNLHTPQISRALEYELDQVNKIAVLVQEFSHDPPSFASVMGNAQHLPGGNTVIGWGSAYPAVSEVRPNGEIAFEMSFDHDYVISYRAFRFPWHGLAARPYIQAEMLPGKLRLLCNKFGDTSVVKYYIYLDTIPSPVTIIDSTTTSFIELSNLPNDTYYVRAAAMDSFGNLSDFSDELELELVLSYYYLPGDANMFNGEWPPAVIGSDVTYLVNYFRQDQPSEPCLINSVFASADVNGDCQVIGSDVTRLVQYFRNLEDIEFCPDVIPEWRGDEDIPSLIPLGWPFCED